MRIAKDATRRERTRWLSRWTARKESEQGHYAERVVRDRWEIRREIAVRRDRSSSTAGRVDRRWTCHGGTESSCELTEVNEVVSLLLKRTAFVIVDRAQVWWLFQLQ